MSNSIEQLAKIQEALGALKSNNPIDELTAANLIKNGNIDSAINTADLIKVGRLQADVTQVLGGESLDFGSITRLSDCVKNIDDIIIDRLKRKLITLMLLNTGIASLFGAIQGIVNLINTVNSYIAFVNALLDKSLLELLILAKNAGILERSEIFRQIQEKYGNTISNINDILANIDSLNICNMMDLGGGPIPSGVKGLDPKPLPDFGSIINVDNSSIEKKQKYEDVISRIGYAITNVIDFVPNSLSNVSENIPQGPPAVKAALSHLQNFSRAIVNRYATASDDEVGKLRAIFFGEIDRKIEEHSYEWSPETQEFYRQRAKEAIEIAEIEYPTLRDWNLQKNSIYSPGQHVATGITIYGPPMVDITSAVDLKAEERSPELIAKWGESKLKKAEQELIRKGLVPGTLSLNEILKNGAYSRLISGMTCASNRFKGGTKLQLRNPDGSIYDPAGLNPIGIVTVVDTGPASSAELWNHIDMFIDENNYEKYKISNMSAVKIYMVENGTKEAKNYLKAQKKFG